MADQSSLQSIAQWLVGIEETAGQVYRGAASCLRANRDLSEFLDRLASDESWHYHAMVSALDFMAHKDIPLPADVLLDAQTKAHVEDPFRRMQQLLEEGELTEELFLESFLKTEFSEWNTLFLYVVNTLKEFKVEFQYSASEMQHHLVEIEEFLRQLPGGERHLRDMLSVPKVWERRLLIVDDSPIFRSLLSSLLSGLGTIDTADDGQEALDKASKQYFDVIVSDVQMPVMDGPEFFSRLAERHPRIHSRFLFFTATPTAALKTFFRDRDLMFLIKPAPINKLQEAVTEILNRRR